MHAKKDTNEHLSNQRRKPPHQKTRKGRGTTLQQTNRLYDKFLHRTKQTKRQKEVKDMKYIFNRCAKIYQGDDFTIQYTTDDDTIKIVSYCSSCLEKYMEKTNANIPPLIDHMTPL